MQALQAGRHKFLLLELDADSVQGVANRAGFDCQLEESKRTMTLLLTAAERQAPLFLFDASDPGNLGWFSGCSFYVDGSNGSVLRMPITLANARDRSGHLLPGSVRLQIAKEVPADFRFPGRAPLTEGQFYDALYKFLEALVNGKGVGLCGTGTVRALTGRSEKAGSRN